MHRQAVDPAVEVAAWIISTRHHIGGHRHRLRPHRGDHVQVGQPAITSVGVWARSPTSASASSVAPVLVALAVAAADDLDADRAVNGPYSAERTAE